MKATIEKLKKAVESTIPAIAAAMETIRQNIIVFNYGLLFVRSRRKDTQEYVEQATHKCSDYKAICSQLKAKAKERGELQKELAGLPVFAAGRRKELKIKIAELSGEIEKLQFEEKSVMRVFDKADAAGMKKVEEEISASETHIVKLNAQEIKFTSMISCEKEKFDGLKAQTADLDQDELADARLAIRPQMEIEAQNRIRRAEGGRKISLWNFQGSISDADKLLGEDEMTEQCKERERMRHMGPKCKTRVHQQER